MTIYEISTRLGISTRRLRYVLEHDVLPSWRSASEGRGNERSFEGFEAFGIACAAWMLQGGLRCATVKQLFAAVCPSGGIMKKNPLFQAFIARGDSTFEIGDGVNVRLSSATRPRAGNSDTGWRQIATGAELSDNYEPDIRIQINVGKLRSKLKA